MKTTSFILLTLICMCWNVEVSYCQEQLDTTTINRINKFIDRQEKKVFHFGVSVGTRSGIKSESESRAVANILPDTTHFVTIEYLDRLAFIISTSVTAFPFKHANVLKGLGFTVNINLIEIADAQNGTTFNKSIDGGFGFAYSLDKDCNFALALTYERTSTRRPQKWVIDKEGEPIIVDGQAITTIDKNDDSYYIDSGLNAWSIKFIYHFK